jgi:23S rRNA-/tRNA-specific pseudouridylate synthase
MYIHRAQMALLGCPLLGDPLYGPIAHYGLDTLLAAHA